MHDVPSKGRFHGVTQCAIHLQAQEFWSGGDSLLRALVRKGQVFHVLDVLLLGIHGQFAVFDMSLQQHHLQMRVCIFKCTLMYPDSVRLLRFS